MTFAQHAAGAAAAGGGGRQPTTATDHVAAVREGRHCSSEFCGFLLSFCVFLAKIKALLTFYFLSRPEKWPTLCTEMG